MHHRLILFLLLILASASAVAQPSRRVALIIGNSNYVSAGPLANTQNDARLVEESARRAGFTDVVVANDLDFAGFNRTLRDFRDRAAGAQVAMIYYAGHGVESGGRNWLIPTDARLSDPLDLPYTAVDLDRALEAVSGARLRIVVLDACRNNPFTRSWPSSTRNVAQGLRAVEIDDVLVIFAAAPGQVAADGQGGNSPFATSFAARLVEPNLAIQLLGGSVRDDVLNATGGAQRPYVSASITGTPIYLVRATGPQVAAASPPIAPPPQVIDMQRQRLGYAMQSSRDRRQTQLDTQVENNVYFFFLGDPPAGTRLLSSYHIIIGRRPDRSWQRLCQVRGDFYVVGVEYQADPTARDGVTTIRMLGRADRALAQRVCQGLTAPLSSLSVQSANSRSGSSVFDWLRQGRDIINLMIVPGSVGSRSHEDLLVRHYWSAGLSIDYARLPTEAQLTSDPETASQLSNLSSGRPSTIHVPVQGFENLQGANGLEAYPSEARLEYGDRIARLDAEWLEFLSRSTIRYRNQDWPALTQRSSTQVFPRFSPGEVGTPAFWRAAHDMRGLYQQMNCYAARFLFDRRYTPVRPSQIGRC